MSGLFENKQKTNVESVNYAFQYQEFDKNHYNRLTGLFRFNAIYELDTVKKAEVYEFLSKLCKLPIIPSRIIIYEDEISVDWEPNGRQVVVSSKDQYRILALEFAQFIDETGIVGLKINTGSFDDSPDEILDNKVIDYAPKFNRNCFGHIKFGIIDMTAEL